MKLLINDTAFTSLEAYEAASFYLGYISVT